ncbi:MAG: HAD-IC family P-type ATPase, partial [Clostridia bacterium]|nr:HAD-IC family P-type ATPase [Clostridia bacterium]
EKNGLNTHNAESFDNVPGKGIKAAVDGKTVLVGSAKLLEENGVDIPDIGEMLTGLAKNGETPLLCAIDSAFAGIISCADAVKPSSRTAVETLGGMGIDTVMLTGDNELTAQAIASGLGISHVVSGVLPDGKADEVRRLKQNGKVVVMLGDGINDAPALKTADIGMAIGAGTDVAIESADVILMNSDPLDAANAVSLSRAVIRNIKQNLFWAFFYNVIMIPVAAGALSGIGIDLSPMIASAAMSLSSIFVVTNALRLRRFSFIPTSGTINTEKEIISATRNKEENDMKIKIEGMMCQHCQARVQKALDAINGVSAQVDLESGTATVSAPENVTKEMLKKAIEDAGYEVTSIE